MQLHPQEFIKIDFHFETMKLKPETGYANLCHFRWHKMTICRLFLVCIENIAYLCSQQVRMIYENL